MKQEITRFITDLAIPFISLLLLVSATKDLSAVHYAQLAGATFCMLVVHVWRKVRAYDTLNDGVFAWLFCSWLFFTFSALYTLYK